MIGTIVETEVTDVTLVAQKITTTTIITDAAAKTEMMVIEAATEAIEAAKTTKLSTAKRADKTRYRHQKVVLASVTMTLVETLRAETTPRSSRIRCRSVRLMPTKLSVQSPTISKPTTSPLRLRRSRMNLSNSPQRRHIRSTRFVNSWTRLMPKPKI